jgi:hypothetical protein
MLDNHKYKICICYYLKKKNNVFQVGTHKEQIVIDPFTEATMANKQRELQKEAVELTSYVKKNQDITQTLMNVCQR